MFIILLYIEKNKNFIENKIKVVEKKVVEKRKNHLFYWKEFDTECLLILVSEIICDSVFKIKIEDYSNYDIKRNYDIYLNTG